MKPTESDATTVAVSNNTHQAQELSKLTLKSIDMLLDPPTLTKIDITTTKY